MRPRELIPIVVIAIALLLGAASLVESHYLDAAAFAGTAYAIAYADRQDPTP